MDSSVDRAVAAIAEGQYGAFTRAQARGVGATDEMMEYRIAAGRWIVRSRPVLAIAGTPRSFRGELRAATLSVMDSVAAQEAAAELWRMIGLARGRVVVMAPRGSNHRLDFATVRETSSPVGGQTRIVDGIPVASRERTVCDVARLLRPDRLGRLLDHQVSGGWIELPDLYEVFYGWARRGRPGVRKLRAVLDARGPGFVATESELEFRTLELIRSGGLPDPALQVELTFWEALVGRVDFVYRDARLIIEVDGRKYHGAETFEADRRRDNAANLAGWRVLRFTWRMVTGNPEYVLSTIREALRLAARTPTGGTILV
jgi:hypothetical protein